MAIPAPSAKRPATLVCADSARAPPVSLPAPTIVSMAGLDDEEKQERDGGLENDQDNVGCRIAPVAVPDQPNGQPKRSDEPEIASGHRVSSGGLVRIGSSFARQYDVIMSAFR